MSAFGAIGQSQHGANSMDGGGLFGGTVSFAAINGPRAGEAVSDRASTNVLGSMGGTRVFGLELPVLLVLAVGFWYALKQFE